MVCFMHRTDGLKNFVRRLRLIALCALLVSGIAWALDSVVPVRYSVQKTVTGGATTSATWKVSRGASTTFVERSFVTSSASLGKVVKSALRGGAAGYIAYEAAKAIVNGAGWAINELTGQLTDPSVAGDPIAAGAMMWVWKSNNLEVARFASPHGLCAWLVANKQHLGWPSYVGTSNPRVVNIQNLGSMMQANCIYTADFGGDGVGEREMYIHAYPNGTGEPVYETGNEPREVTLEELGERAAQNTEKINQILNQGGVAQMTPELVAQTNELTDALAAKDGQPAPPHQEMPTQEQQDETNKQPVEEEWPKFCTWASIVCEWIDWSKKDEITDEKPDVPIDPVTLPDQNWNSGLPSDASCPSIPGFSFSLMGQSVNQEINVGPLCTTAEMFRPFVIALSVLIAAYIIGGVRNDA